MFTAPRPTLHRKERHILNGEENCGFRIANFGIPIGVDLRLNTKFAIRNPQSEIFHA